MAVQQVFSSDDLRKKILSYVVYDVYKCSFCGECCSPLDSILYKEKTHIIVHFDEDGNEYVENYFENSKTVAFIPQNIMLCNEFTTEYHQHYKYTWTHKNCCNHYASNGIRIAPMYMFLHEYINHTGTIYYNIKTNGSPDCKGEHLKELLYDGNLLFKNHCDGNSLFKKHKHKKRQEKAEYFENLMYKIAVTKINLKNSIAKKRFETANDGLNERRERIKQNKTKEMLQIIRPEIFTNMLIKKYQQKEINFNTFRKSISYIETYRYNNNLHIIE